MISRLKGKVLQKSPTELVVDVGGIGYSVHISLSTFAALEHVEGDATILTHLHVREDALQLYGFATQAERDLFRLLISVSGIGPRMAQGILSGLNPAELKSAIASGNIAALTSVSGVGTKTAERIILELRDKVARAEAAGTGGAPSSAELKARSEAIVALMSLGFTRPNAEKALQAVLREADHQQLSVEEMIRRALHHAAR